MVAPFVSAETVSLWTIPDGYFPHRLGLLEDCECGLDFPRLCRIRNAVDYAFPVCHCVMMKLAGIIAVILIARNTKRLR